MRWQGRTCLEWEGTPNWAAVLLTSQDSPGLEQKQLWGSQALCPPAELGFPVGSASGHQRGGLGIGKRLLGTGQGYASVCTESHLLCPSRAPSPPKVCLVLGDPKGLRGPPSTPLCM